MNVLVDSAVRHVLALVVLVLVLVVRDCCWSAVVRTVGLDPRTNVAVRVLPCSGRRVRVVPVLVLFPVAVRTVAVAGSAVAVVVGRSSKRVVTVGPYVLLLASLFVSGVPLPVFVGTLIGSGLIVLSLRLVPSAALRAPPYFVRCRTYLPQLGTENWSRIRGICLCREPRRCAPMEVPGWKRAGRVLPAVPWAPSLSSR